MSPSLPSREEKLTQLFHVTAEKYWNRKQRSHDMINAEDAAFLKSVNYPVDEFLDFVENKFGLSEDHLKWKLERGETGGMALRSNLAYMYFNGFGVDRDYAKALYWYKKAAELGAVSSQCALGYMYTNGLGVPQDYVQAAHWFGISAEQGAAYAQLWLGRLYLRGQGVQQDEAKAIHWLSKAAAQGDAEAREELIKLDPTFQTGEATS